MSFPFHTLQEFTAAQENDGIFSEIEGLIEGLNVKKLVALLGSNRALRRVYVKRWFGEVGRLCNQKIKLKISRTPVKPYMTESGEVGLSRTDFKRTSYLFFASAHEAAHFLLMRDGEYDVLKALDREYPKDEMRSPIEYCANLLTLALFERCLNAEKREGRRQKISWCIEQLKLQSEQK